MNTELVNNNNELSKSNSTKLMREIGLRTPPSKRDDSECSQHSISNRSINNFINFNNDEQISKILDIKLDTDKTDMDDLNAFCYNMIQKKFKEAIRVNSVVPAESDKKEFKLKIFQNTNATDIKKKIVDTIRSRDSNIQKFIDTTIDTLLLGEMRMMERSYVSLQNSTFHKIIFSSKLHKPFFSTNYYSIKINLLSVVYL